MKRLNGDGKTVHWAKSSANLPNRFGLANQSRTKQFCSMASKGWETSSNSVATFQWLQHAVRKYCRDRLVVEGTCLSLDGVSHCATRQEPYSLFDFQCPMLSLPLAFGTRADTIPAKVPYLRTPPGRNGRRSLGRKISRKSASPGQGIRTMCMIANDPSH